MALLAGALGIAGVAWFASELVAGVVAAGSAGCLPCIARDGLNNLLAGAGVLASGALAAGSLASGGLSAGGRGAAQAGRGAARVARDTLNTALAAGEVAADTLGVGGPPAYTPGESEVPRAGDTLDFPGMGPATVNSVDHTSQSMSGLGGPPMESTRITTNRGTVTYTRLGDSSWGSVQWHTGPGPD